MFFSAFFFLTFVFGVVILNSMQIVNAPEESFINFQMTVRDLVRANYRVVPFLGFEIRNGASAEGGIALGGAYVITGSRKLLIPSSVFLKVREHPNFPNFLLLSKKNRRVAAFVFFNGDVVETRFDLV